VWACFGRFTIYALSVGDAHLVSDQLGESLVGTAQIVFFLMGAMTIVEVVDAHSGFEVITTRIKTSKLSTLMWLVGLVTFFLSAILDNLTTTIVMISLMRKLLAKHDDRLSVATLEHANILTALAKWLDQTVGRQEVIVMIIGMASAIVDNVPQVAASMGMYSLTQYPPDHFFWEFFGLLCWHRWFDSDHWFCGWRGSHGSGKNPLLLVRQKNQRFGFDGLPGRCGGLPHSVPVVPLKSVLPTGL